jgi:amino acid adenylation domain-containing protein
MTTHELLARLSDLQVRIALDGTDLRVITPPSAALGEEIWQELKLHKEEVRNLLQQTKRAREKRRAPITRANRTAEILLSFAQRRLWFLAQMEGGSGAYHVPVAFRLKGKLNQQALQRALDRVVARHEALRTTFVTSLGQPAQRIAPAEESGFHLLMMDAQAHADIHAELDRIVTEEAATPFDLENGPVIRGRLIQLGKDEHWLLITMHHIVADGWSMSVLLNEMSALYSAFLRGENDPLPELAIQYADYALWERMEREGETFRQQEEYWKSCLAGAPTLLELPSDYPRPAERDYAGAVLKMELGAGLTAGLKALSRRYDVTLHMTLLAAWGALLARLSGQPRVVIGMPAANRAHKDIERLIGFFVNMLPILVDSSGSPNAGELLERVKTQVLAAQEHQDIPFERVVEIVQPERSLAHTPLFQAMFSWHPPQAGAVHLPEVVVERLAGAPQTTAKFDLSLTLQEAGDKIAGSVEYATSLFSASTVERYAGYLQKLLQGMVREERAPIHGLAILAEEEHKRILEQSQGIAIEHSAGTCLHNLFEERAEEIADTVAVEFEDATLTYGELNRRANQMARYLRQLGAGPDVPVGICLTRGLEMIVGLLAVLKAGAAYVPLDPAYPTERLQYMIADSAPTILLTQAHLRAAIDCLRQDTRIVDVQEASSLWNRQPGTNLGIDAIGLSPANIAYLIYTSGSTGRPKGTAIAHCNAINLVRWAASAFSPDILEKTLFSTSLNFDLSIFECFAPLAVGATIRVVNNILDIERVAEVTLINAVPSAITALVDNAKFPAALRVANLAGEPLKKALVGQIFANTSVESVCNLYGPTETTTYSTYAPTQRQAEFSGHVGRPIWNTQAYVLAEELQLVPPGTRGDLYLGGAGVARGYLHRVDMTAERFVPDFYSSVPGARMYKTGDVARWLPDGNLDLLGRNDDQVKIRGYRIEPREIEARLLEHAAVREAVVVASEDIPGDKRLIVYFTAQKKYAETPEDGEFEDGAGEQLRQHLLARLPEHMVPGVYVRLDKLPFLSNGKLDRKSLPAPDHSHQRTATHERPRGDLEIALAEIWEEVLRIEHIGRYDNFFAIGGHSLLALQITSRVQQRLKLNASLGDLLARPRLADFAAGLSTEKTAELPPIARAERSRKLPLSFAQQRIWFLNQVAGVGAAYHMFVAFRLKGRLDANALRRALDRILARHEGLRTTFASLDGEPVQCIQPPEEAHFRLEEMSLESALDPGTHLQALLIKETTKALDLEKGPLVRGLLLRESEREHVLHVTFHHIIADGWSVDVFRKELSTLYAAYMREQADPLPELDVQYADYAAWQHTWAHAEVLQAQADYWQQTLEGAPAVLELPADRARPATQDYSGGSLKFELDAELSQALKKLSREHGVTLYMTLLTAWAALLGRLSAQDDLVIGTPVANRARPEIERLIGLFVNTLAVRMDLSGAPTVGELLERVKRQVLSVQRHRDLPFERVVELAKPVRSLAHSPLFQVMFSWQQYVSGAELTLPEISVEPLSGIASGTSKFDLTLALTESGKRIVGGFEYATSLFDHATVERYAEYYRTLLRSMAAEPWRRVQELPMLPRGEWHWLVYEWNATEAKYASGKCLHEVIEQQAEDSPEKPAVVFQDAVLSYQELNRRANQLAHYLRELGVGPDARVGVCLERSPEMLVSLLAVLKAGGAYVPLDPSYPADRLRNMVADSRPMAVLTGGQWLELFSSIAPGSSVLEADAAELTWQRHPQHNLSPASLGLSPENLAYVIYTSGSTGRPKGVMIPHLALTNFLAAMRRELGIERDDTVLATTTISFDIAALELYLPLTVGAQVRIATREARLDGSLLKQELQRGVTMMQATPTNWQMLFDAGWAGDQNLKVLCGGEALKSDLASSLVAGSAQGWNLYGPTETTVWSMIEPLSQSNRRVTIGRPIANTQIHVIDRNGNPAPVGAIGEIHIAGAGVARGYFELPAVTAERFVPDCFSLQPGGRMYATGDLGRRLSDGRVEFAGRNDFQVKVRGYRIELSEIEAHLKQRDEVRDAVVVAREYAPGDVQLIAYYTGSVIGPDQLRLHLASRLPEYMVPAAYVHLEQMPLTPNGKIDRKSLPVPQADATATSGYEEPVGELEVSQAAHWEELLRVPRVGRRDNFFELGGHSLLAVRAVSRLRKTLDREVTIGDLFAHPVLTDFVRAIEHADGASLPPVTPVAGGKHTPLSFSQQRLWWVSQMEGASGAYQLFRGWRFRGPLNRPALRQALDSIVARHQPLRTTFVSVNGEPEQRIAAAEDSWFHMEEHELTEVGSLEQLVRQELETGFNLERGPLIRGHLIQENEDQYFFFLATHHIVSDAWSFGVLFRELGSLYASFAQGQAAQLPQLRVHYADYAVWQRRCLDGEVLQSQADYWKQALAGAPALLELPTDFPRPRVQNFSGAWVRVTLDEELTRGLRELSRRHGTTLFMTLAAGWAALLARLSGQDDIVLGTPVANRGRAEIEDLIGVFVNLLALRVDLSGSPDIGELLERVKRQALAVQLNQDIPFEQVIEIVKPVQSRAHSPLCQVGFDWQYTPEDRLSLPGLQIDPVSLPLREVAKFDLRLWLTEAGAQIVGGLEYATALFDRSTVERYTGYLRALLQQMVTQEKEAVERLPFLPAKELQQALTEWHTEPDAFAAGGCVHELFQEQVESATDAVALVFEDTALSYGELNRRANQLAHYLRGLGVRPDSRVAICLERGLERIIALLSAWKAGGAYVPLESGDPVDRLRAMVADSRPVAVLTKGDLRKLFAGAEVNAVLDMGEVSPPWSEQPELNPAAAAVGVEPAHLAYVIYTSGSTGLSKGVMVEHRQLANYVAAVGSRLNLEEGWAYALVSTFAADLGVTVLIPSLLRSGCLHLLPREASVNGERFARYCLDRRVDCLKITPTHFQALLGNSGEKEIVPAQRLVFGGETLSRELIATVKALRPECHVFNHYGPTECTVGALAGETVAGGRESKGPVALGRPMAGMNVYVLDKCGELQPAGVAGEIHIGGAGVTRGYLDRAAQTAERFVPDPFSGKSGGRMYKTGDLGRWTANGQIQFLGRKDFQVKIRGYRVELGEIEACLTQLESVRDAVVVLREDASGDRRLLAYYTSAQVGETSSSPDDLRAHLARALPEYMLPAAYVRLHELPLTVNGKIDRKALPEPEEDAYGIRDYEEPIGEIEKALAGIWEEILNVKRVGRRDNFFHLGGHSLLAVGVVMRLQQAFNIEVTIGDLFDSPVLASLAERLLNLQLAQFDSDVLADLVNVMRRPDAN